MTSPLALYIHWPFCLAKCPYCDFNSHVAGAVDQAAWRRALLAELNHSAAILGRRRLTSVFLGGGTPSLMDPATVAALLDRAAALWTIDSDIEITLEANPGAIDAERFRDIRAAGVGRLSLGVQSFDDIALRDLGRVHDSAAARRAASLARETFPRVSLDLLYARPGQTEAAWIEDLGTALACAPDHLSAYQLTIEPGTRFAGDGRQTADEQMAERLYDLTRDSLDAAGLPAYEISNHARPGAESRHNLTYWRGGDYLGIGPGAHGRETIAGLPHAVRRRSDPDGWRRQVAARGHGTLDRIALTPDERRDERLLMGLRLVEGIDLGAPPQNILNSQRLRTLCDDGFLVVDGTRVRATDDGRKRLNAVLAYLLA